MYHVTGFAHETVFVQQGVAEVLLEASDIPEDLSAHLPFLSTTSRALGVLSLAPTFVSLVGSVSGPPSLM